MTQDVEEDLQVAEAAAAATVATAEGVAGEEAAAAAAELCFIQRGQRDVATADARHSVDGAWLQLARYESASDTTCTRQLRPRSWGGNRGAAGGR